MRGGSSYVYGILKMIKPIGMIADLSDSTEVFNLSADGKKVETKTWKEIKGEANDHKQVLKTF